jgi:hypothetical protein
MNDSHPHSAARLPSRSVAVLVEMPFTKAAVDAPSTS